MRAKSRGRGVAATFGLLLVLAGVAGAVALWLLADRRPEQAVDGFARGPVGCTTTLAFEDTGTFWVYEEVVGADADAFEECPPVATPGAEFGVQLLDEGDPVTLRADTSISYATDTGTGTSVGRIDIAEPGRYELVVDGDDPSIVAAVGRDPEQGVDDLRRGSIAVGAVGLLLGTLLLLLAGRRSKRAATFAPPSGPGWGPTAPVDGRVPATPPLLAPRVEAPAAPSVTPAPTWPPEPPRLPPVPVVAAPGEPAPPTEPVTAPPAVSWGPPEASDRRDPPA